jgi:hypothetical protein
VGRPGGLMRWMVLLAAIGLLVMILTLGGLLSTR